MWAINVFIVVMYNMNYIGKDISSQFSKFHKKWERYCRKQS